MTFEHISAPLTRILEKAADAQTGEAAMNREDVIRAVSEKMDQLGVPKHVQSLRKVPASVECNVLLGGAEKFQFKARSGITRMELNFILQDLENRWILKNGPTGKQIDLEEKLQAAE